MTLSLLDKCYLEYKKRIQNIKDTQRWSVKRVSTAAPLVYYGFEELPVSGEHVSGGIVKCLDLASRYPNTVKNANILYLVSSSLPVNVLSLIRIARKHGVKVVVNQNGVAYPAWHGRGWQKTNRMLQSVLWQADFVVFQSKFCKCTVEKFLGSIPSLSEILYNPVNTTLFCPLRKSLLSNTLLVAGSHHHPYRVRLALETLNILRAHGLDLKLRVAGPLRWHRDEQLARRDFWQWCKEWNLKKVVRLTGSYSQQQVGELFCDSDILLHVQYNDVCPRLLVEAMSFSLPVVYSNSGGSPELVGNKAGLGVDVPISFEKTYYPQPQELADAVTCIYADYDTYSQAARQRAVSCFDSADWLDQHQIIFGNLLR